MKTQIVYALVAASETFLYEMWASIYSLRLYEPERDVRVCCDDLTAKRINHYPELVKLITEIVVISVPEEFGPTQRSREIKTTIRQYVTGNCLFVDTDTIFAGTLEFIDSLKCDVAAVPEYHVLFSKSFNRNSDIAKVRTIYHEDISDAKFYFNSGVIYSADSPLAHRFYNQWHANWLQSLWADQPPFAKTDKELGFVVQELPGEYNCQFALGITYFFEAKIIHFLHFDLLPKPKNPFLDRSLYHQIEADGMISKSTSYIIQHCKSAFITPTAIIDGKTVDFLLSTPGHVFLRIYEHGGWMLSFMNKIAALFAAILKRQNIKAW